MPLSSSPARIISAETTASRMPRMRPPDYVHAGRAQQALDGPRDEAREQGEEHDGGEQPAHAVGHPPTRAFQGQFRVSSGSIDRQDMIQQARVTRDSYRIPPAGQFSQLPLVERRLRFGLLWMKSGGAVEHSLRHVPQTVLAHAEPHDARGQPDGADHVLLLDGDSPDLLA